MRHFVILATCFGLAACGGGSAPSPEADPRVLSESENVRTTTTSTGSNNGGNADDSYQRQQGDTGFAKMLNNVRLEVGAGSVRYDGRLDAAAQAHADDMLARGYFSHDSPEGEDGYDRITREGYDPIAWGENIAAYQRTEAEVLRGWQNSPSHNRMMTADVFEDFGFAMAGSGRDTRWVLVMGTEAD